MKLTRFIVLFLIFNLLLALPPGIAEVYYPDKWFLIPDFGALFGIFSTLTLFIYLIAYWRMGISNKASGQVLLGSVTIKLLTCMVMAFIYLSNHTVDPSKFLLNFFYLYFFHTVFELYCLLCNLRNQILK